MTRSRWWSHYWWRAFPASNRWVASVRELDEAERVLAHTMGGLRPKDADTIAARKTADEHARKRRF